jgi:hypothetical protein
MTDINFFKGESYIGMSIDGVIVKHMYVNDSIGDIQAVVDVDVVKMAADHIVMNYQKQSGKSIPVEYVYTALKQYMKENVA